MLVLDVCSGGLSRGGLCPGRVSVQGGLCPEGDPLPLPVNRITDVSKNITLPKTSFAGGKDFKSLLSEVIQWSSMRIFLIHSILCLWTSFQCVPPTLYRTVGRSLSRGVSVRGESLSRGVSFKETPFPPVDRQTPVKILPCPKLLLRAVITSISRDFGAVELL